MISNTRRQPGQGFALQSTASSAYDRNILTNDPYENHSQSALNHDEIWAALTTEGGRQVIAAQMAVPIREELDYVGVARKFFEIDVLAQGQIARYDKDINVEAYVVSKRGAVDQWIVEGDYVEPNTWEVFSPGAIRLSQIQQRRFNIIDRTQEKIRIETQIQEDDQFLALLNSSTDKNIANNPIVDSTTGADKDFFNDLSATVMDHDLPCYGFLMRFSTFKDVRSWDNTELDPVTMRSILETGLYGTLWGIDMIGSRRTAKKQLMRWLNLDSSA